MSLEADINRKSQIYSGLTAPHLLNKKAWLTANPVPFAKINKIVLFSQCNKLSYVAIKLSENLILQGKCVRDILLLLQLASPWIFLPIHPLS